MRPERNSKRLLAITRSKAKMYEYGVPMQDHIDILRDPSRLFPLTIGILGDLAAEVNSEPVDGERQTELQDNLRFASYFLDSYRESKLDVTLDPYLLLLASASYYLCGRPGSSRVLANKLSEDMSDADCIGMDKLMAWLLKGDFATPLADPGGLYGEHISVVSQSLATFFQNGSGDTRLLQQVTELRRIAYRNGTPRELLIADVIGALVKSYRDNSTWYCLPRHSELPPTAWLPTLQRTHFMRELWPAQRLLGEHGVFRGESALVQMPTSAGKTRATQLIIRSAFLSCRASLAVIVAPFRALCHEIRASLTRAFHGEAVNVEEFSDALQMDFEIDSLLGRNQILVMTPEKLVYTLRHAPELAARIGLLIYDEGHQFDNPTRGVTYELLLASLKALVPARTQTVLMSAVISNAEAISSWLADGGSKVVSGIGLGPTHRTVAFASWLKPLGQLKFVQEDDPDIEEFFVPRVIQEHQLKLIGREYKPRTFPEKGDGQSVALYLGLRLAQNGTVAVFCGTKRAAVGLCKRLVDTYRRGLPIPEPARKSNENEVQRLHCLHQRHFGHDTAVTESAKLGVLSHHGNTPQGIRLAVEHALKDGLVRFVICTSTLAQGVNLPIRYLIVTSIYQGKEQIKVRDFHNLIGRAGRSGIHTEGSILFADPEVYDKRGSRRGQRRWTLFKQLLNPNNSEPCASALLSLFDTWENSKGIQVVPMEPLPFLEAYVSDPPKLSDFLSTLVTEYASRGLTMKGLEEQMEQKLDVIAAIESYIMAHWDDSESGTQEGKVKELARGTLAYHLADEEKREYIVDVFDSLRAHIERTIPDVNKRRVFGRTLYGVKDCRVIEDWVIKNWEHITACETYEELLLTLWPLLKQNIGNSNFRKSRPAEPLRDLAIGWIQGQPFYELHAILTNAGVRIGEGARPLKPQVEHVADICQNGLAYDGMLALGSIIEITAHIHSEGEDHLISKLRELQKRLRYGLPSTSAIPLYEVGFADRVVAIELSEISSLSAVDGGVSIREALQRNEEQVRELLNHYPKYFTAVLENIVT